MCAAPRRIGERLRSAGVVCGGYPRSVAGARVAVIVSSTGSSFRTAGLDGQPVTFLSYGTYRS
jgi:hypothetical protein